MTAALIVCYAIASVNLVVAMWSTGATIIALARRATRRKRSRGMR